MTHPAARVCARIATGGSKGSTSRAEHLRAKMGSPERLLTAQAALAGSGARTDRSSGDGFGRVAVRAEGLRPPEHLPSDEVGSGASGA